MSLVVGTNCGFVTSAPVDDPEGATLQINENIYFAEFDTSPINAAKISEVGWYCDTDQSEANFEVGLYEDDAGNPGTLLEVSRTNVKTTGTGWKTVSVDWAISPNTKYWIAVQCDYVDGIVYTNTGVNIVGAKRAISNNGKSSLDDEFDLDANGDTWALSFYAVWEEAPATGGQDGPYVY